MKYLLCNQGAGFEPEDFGFVYLPEHQNPLGLKYYEYANHRKADGTHCYRRCNLYLSLADNHVHCWYGYLESIITGQFLTANGIEVDDHPLLLWDQSVFLGSIDSKELAEHILGAIAPSSWLPTELKIGLSREIISEALAEH